MNKGLFAGSYWCWNVYFVKLLGKYTTVRVRESGYFSVILMSSGALTKWWRFRKHNIKLHLWKDPYVFDYNCPTIDISLLEPMMAKSPDANVYQHVTNILITTPLFDLGEYHHERDIWENLASAYPARRKFM